MIELRPYQNETVDKTIDYLKSKQGNPLIGMPTASGKSIVLSEIIRRLVIENLHIRILKLVHTKELVVQNMQKMKALLPECDLGILSAGLNSFDTSNQVIFGGVGTVANRISSIGSFDYIIVDEAHSISDKETSSYQKILTSAKLLNPNVRLIGLTATPFRLGKGSIIDGNLFHDFSINLTKFEEFNKLLDAGYLCNLVPRLPENIIHTDDVKIQKGDFNITELQNAVIKNDITTKALKEAVAKGINCNKWIVFCAGVEHAKNACETLNALGIKSTYVHSDMSSNEIDHAINGFKSGEYKAICNNNILTVGFDCPEIDLIVMLRPTMSPVLWVQMLGRGCRIHPNKPNGCLVLDFAYNTQRLGCINDITLPKKRVPKQGECPVKLCPECQVYNHISARVCISCGAEFKIQQKIKKFSAVDELIKRAKTEPIWVDVIKVTYKPIFIKNITSLQAFYHCDGIKVKENIMFGRVKQSVLQKSINWWFRRIKMVGLEIPFPESAIQAFKNIYKIKSPSRIEIKSEKNKCTILSYEFIVSGERIIIK